MIAHICDCYKSQIQALSEGGRNVCEMFIYIQVRGIIH